MLEFIQDNINWVKDFFTIIFVGTGTIVTILTYRRANKTLLQPIRTEVIKKQSILLSKLLKIISEYSGSGRSKLDYEKVIKFNAFVVLSDYGVKFSNEEKLDIEKKEMTILFPNPKKKEYNNIKEIKTFEEDSTEEELGNKYEQLRKELIDNNEVNIELISISQKLMSTINALSEFAGNPFMPKSIQSKLKQLIDEITTNFQWRMVEVIEDFVIKFFIIYDKTKKIPKINLDGLYNDFLEHSIDHTQTLSDIKNEIRRYLRIDDEW